MSTEKPKRPSARPQARPSSVPPPPAEPVPEVRVEVAASPEVPGASRPRLDRKLRISARRAASRQMDDAPKAPTPARAPVQVERPARPKVTPARKPAAIATKAPTASVTQPSATDPAKVQVEAEPSAAEPAPLQVEAKPSATEPAPLQVETKPSSTEPVLEAQPQAPVDVSAAHDDDDIWSEADAGTSALMTALASEESELGTSEPAGRSEPPAPVSRLARSRRDGPRDQAVRLGSVESLVSTDYYVRQYGAHGMRSLSAEVDEFGLDPHVEERARPWLEGLCKRYFRVDVDGVQNLPADGRVLMVGNRAGALPWDGLVLRTAVRMARPGLQPMRWLAEDSVFHYPFLGVFMNRLGAVRACPENAERLLRQDRLVAVFPEGAHGSGKLFKDRYRLQRFGRGGYVKLALKLGAPVVPTAIIGSEETNPVLARSRVLGRLFGGESLPITPTFPWLGAAGLLPAPVKWRIVIGEPIDLSAYGPRSADDALVVHRLNEQIRGILQSLVEQTRGSRRSVLFG